MRNDQEIELLVEFTEENEFLSKFKNTPKLKQLCWAMRLATYSQDEVIIVEGEIGDKFYIIADGLVGVHKGSKVDNKIVQRHLCDLLAGDSFGEMALTQDIPRSMTAIAKTECKIVTLDQESYLTVVKGLRSQQMESIA